MRKKYLIAITILFVIFLITSFLPFYKPLYFYTKHISLFILVSLIIFGILKYFYNELKIEYKSRINLIKVLTIITFGIILFGFSEAQMIYIETYETPDIDGCSYYDSYGNLIYDTILPMSCGELEVKVNTPDKLEITITERLSGEFRAGESIDVDMFPAWGDSFSGFKKTDITVTYDSKGRMLTAELLSSTNYEIIDNESVYSYNPYIYYNSFKREVINEYFEDSFKSTQKIYVIDDEIGSWTSLEEIEHYNFTEDEGVTKILRSDIFSSTGEFNIFKISKETIVDEVSTIEDVAMGYFKDLGIEYSNEIHYDVLINEEYFEGESKYVVYPGEGSFRETHEMSAYNLFYSIEFEDYKGIKNLHKVKSFELIDQDLTINANNSYSRTMNRIYTDVEGNSLGIIEETEFGFRIAYYALPDGFLSRDSHDSRWKINMLTTANSLGGKYNLYKIFDYEEDLIDDFIYMYFVYDENPLISIYYD